MCTILAFFTENQEKDHLFFGSFTEGNIAKKNMAIRSTTKRIYIFFEMRMNKLGN